MPIRFPAHRCIARTALLASIFAVASATSLSQKPPAGNPDGQIVTAPESSPAAGDPPTAETAWTMLKDAVKDPKHPDLRIQALAALGTLNGQLRADKLIRQSMTDPELDVRTAAILAAGQSKTQDFTFELRSALDDPEPQVAFAAATTLWKMGDRSGADVLLAIIQGERSASPTLINGARHTVSRELHNPSSLARLGAMQGASFLLGPFGFGLTALEYMRRNGGDAARVEAIELIAHEKTAPIRDELIDALSDRDPAVRAAAAKALGQYHDTVAAQALVPVLNDPKAPVRLTAAAAFLNANLPVVRTLPPARVPLTPARKTRFHRPALQ